VGEELRVDVQLADAPRDQLGELAAEVEDDDRVGFCGVPAIVRRSGRFGSMKGRLEIGLYLCVVRGQHAMTRVRCFAVDGLAPLAGAVAARRGRAPLRR